ncbi:hypothetical protein BDQ17DRAFT_1536810 [Cyathus striatus]|nr:hypothetical protein BDQ17DRAFT_1536810 [Cyathus striatus]
MDPQPVVLPPLSAAVGQHMFLPTSASTHGQRRSTRSQLFKSGRTGLFHSVWGYTGRTSSAQYYKQEVINARGRAEQGGNDVGERILLELRRMNRRLRRLSREFRAFSRRIEPLTVMSHNLQCDLGLVMPLAVMPFADGRIPTVPPLSLPPLLNVTVIDGLDYVQSAVYFRGYYPALPLPEHPTRIAGIKRAVGCIVLS